MHKVTSPLLALALAAGSFANSAAGAPAQRRQQTPPPPPAPQTEVEPEMADDEPIELSTDLVNVLFSVTDRSNRFVGDLKETDFVVTENGVKQQVFSFRREQNLPLSVAMLIDVSSSQEHTFGDEKRAAAAFLQKVLKPKQDSAAVVTFRDDVQYVQGLTERIERVADTFNRLNWETRQDGGSRYGATALYDAIALTSTELFPPDESAANPESVVRRAIVLMTDGDDTASDRTLQQSIDEALRAGIIVYVVGVGDRYRSTSVKRDVLQLIAGKTGGRAYFPESYDDLSGAFKQIEEELRSQYVLAYEPTRVARDGSFREVVVTVPGRSDVKVFHRKGYFAPRGIPDPPAPGARTASGTRP